MGFVSFNIVLPGPLVLFFSTHNVGSQNDLDLVHLDSWDILNFLYASFAIVCLGFYEI